MNLKGSKTEQNLQAAFAGESQAHTKYEYYASVAKKRAMNRLAASSTKHRIMKKSMQKSGSSCCTAVCPIWTAL